MNSAGNSSFGSPVASVPASKWAWIEVNVSALASEPISQSGISGAFEGSAK